MNNTHISVLLHEAIELLEIKPKHWYIDATFGRGGHTRKLLQAGANVIAFDWDQEAIEYGREAFQKEIEDGQLILVHESFSKLEQALLKLKRTLDQDLKISGILFDFGTSTPQLMSAERGFSFEGEGDLDMRMDTRLGVTAKDILVLVPEKQLVELFRDFGGEDEAKGIARAIKAQTEPITTTGQLAALITSVKRRVRPGMHPATKVFQALRIAVNSELDEIEQALPAAFSILEKNGILVTIAFHDGEDRIVKHQFRSWENNKLAEGITKKPLQPSTTEVTENKRSRSAKLRALRKL